MRDPSVAREVPLPREGLLVGGHRLPPITEPSETDLGAAMMRRSMPGYHGPADGVSMHHNLHHGRLDTPCYVGLGGRAAVVLCLARETRRNLDSVHDALATGEPTLFLHGHQLGEYGLLRAVLVLADEGLAFETPMSLAGGDVQEFLAAAYAGQRIELHLGHEMKDQLLPLAYHARGVRAVLDSALATLAGLPQLSNVAEQNEPLARLRARFPDIRDGLPPDAAVHLESAGRAEPAVRYEIVL
ncbi:hypothetical protein [Streptomyces sp. ME19-01-6]|uniref:hypothetical protein n=1 Tax=Streptomyces sp. ME19-01-6 TaxID=3028686 RepID=UPI0029A05713|nr:hypothetical protein [Streptomyces sp. ME19-01-6]MDX3232622.1 hypothetical protein [Streptomyces sp. ME19-01-6]